MFLTLFIYFLRVYEEGVKPPLADTVLPRDEFPKVRRSYINKRKKGKRRKRKKKEEKNL